MLCISLDSEFCKDFKPVRILRIRLLNRQKISFYYILELKYHVIKQIRNYSVFMPCYAYRSEFREDSKSVEILRVRLRNRQKNSFYDILQL